MKQLKHIKQVRHTEGTPHLGDLGLLGDLRFSSRLLPIDLMSMDPPPQLVCQPVNIQDAETSHCAQTAVVKQQREFGWISQPKKIICAHSAHLLTVPFGFLRLLDMDHFYDFISAHKLLPFKPVRYGGYERHLCLNRDENGCMQRSAQTPVLVLAANVTERVRSANLRLSVTDLRDSERLN